MVLLAEIAAATIFLAQVPLDPLATSPRAATSNSRFHVSTSLNKKRSTEMPTGPSSRSEAEDAKRYFTSCMADWDVATHMTHNEWKTACRRVSNNRAKFLQQHRLELSTGGR